MKNPKAYKNYFGGKESPGTYQTLINLIPPHALYYSPFLGNDAVYRHIKPADCSYLSDIDPDVIKAWNDAGYRDFHQHRVVCADAIKELMRIDLTLNAFLGGMPRVKPEGVFVFLDPPYPLNSRKSNKSVYRFEMTDSDHAVLLAYISHPDFQRYKVMICTYPNDLYHAVLSKWNHKDYYSTIRGGVALERVYYNYPTPGPLHDSRYYGGNFRQREQFKRIQASLVKKVKQVPADLRPSIIADIVTSLQNLNNE